MLLLCSRAEGEAKMSAADQSVNDMEARVARILREASDLAPSAERDRFLEEIQQFIAKLSALKAKIIQPDAQC
jgi:hypothetical protein